MKTIPEPKVQVKEITEVIIHSTIFYNSFEDLSASVIQMAMASHQSAVVLNWCDGIAFLIGFFPDNDKLIDEYLVGTTHWRYVMMAQLPEFKKKVSTTLGEVMLTGRDHDPTVRAAIKALKEKYGL